MTTQTTWPQVSIRQISDMLNVDRDAVRRAISNGKLQPAGKGPRGHSTYDAGELVRALFNRRGDADPAQLSPADRRNLAMAKRAEFELQIKADQFLPRDAVRRANAQAFAMVASSLRSIPDLVERKTGVDAATCELIEATIDSVCNDLADRMESVHRQASKQLEEA